MSKSLKQIYLEAADYLETWGWQQGNYGGRWVTENTIDGPACLVGACISVGCDQPTRAWSHGEGQKIEAGLKNFLGLGTDAFPHEWNDEPGRTKQEVIAKLRECAAVQL